MGHRCLLVPELFGLVCEVLRPYIGNLPDERSTSLAALARTCHAFEGPALDVLWREIMGLRPLLCTMPSDLFQMKETVLYHQCDKERILRIILLSDLTRFSSYAQRIRKIRIGSISFLDAEVIQALNIAMPHMRPLLPNIEHLLWVYGFATKGRERPMLPAIYLFLAPKLTTLSIILFDTSDGISLQSFLSDLVNICPGLKDLTFLIHYEKSNEENRQSLSSAIFQWKELQSLTVTDLTQEALGYLATIPSLRILSFNSLRGATRSYDQRLSIVTRDPTGGYPALQSLSITCRTMDAAIAFIQLLSSSPVEDLEIQVVDRCYLPQWRELFSTINRHICHTSLKELSLEETESHLPPLELADYAHGDIGIDALTVFSNLRIVDVHPSLGIQLNGETVNKLAVAWPHVESLELGNRHSSSISPIITIEDLIPFAKYCPKLEQLGIVFDARNIQLTSLKPGRGLFSNTLSALSVTDSPIDSPALVAAFLSDIFPKIDSITFDCDWRDSVDGDPEDGTDHGRMWDEAEHLLKIFAKVRSQENLKSSMDTDCH